jgi:outer membrane protein OmpA-like peptidoglycan-associated protein
MRKLVFRLTVAVPLLCLVGAAQDIPRAETYFGYSWVRFAGTDGAVNFNANGGTFQLGYNFNRYISLVGDFSGYHKGNLDGLVVNTTMASFMAGPRFSFNKRHRINPYIQGLFGGVYRTVSGLVDFPLPADGTRFGLLAGGGVDIKLGHHVAIRPFEADYFYTQLRHPMTDLARIQDNLRLTAGLNFLWGGEKPTPPPPPPPAKPKMNITLSLVAPRNEVCEGETVSLTPTISATTSPVNYHWTVNGKAAGTGKQFDFATAGLAPGAYRIGVLAESEGYKSAQAETSISVKEYRPPTGTVSASPSEILLGGKASLSAHFEGQCGGVISAPAYTASEGAVNGAEFDSTGVTFDAAAKGEQRKPVTITASATDERNHTGTATTMVTVIQPAPITAVRLPDILFPNNSARVNNCGKRVLLEQLRSYFERDPGGKAVLVGHQVESEAANLSLERVRNAAAVISAGSGICTSVPLDQVIVSSPGVDQGGVGFEPNFCAASVVPERPGQGVSANDKFAEYRRVTVWFVPSGGKLPDSLGTHETAGALNINALGCPK